MTNSSKYTDREIHHVCKLLEENKWQNVEIERITGVSRDVISKIKIRNCWTHISDQYKITIPVHDAIGSLVSASKYTDDQIHEVCKLLTDPDNSYRTIEGKTGVGLDMIYRIGVGKNWHHISSHYIIPKRNLNKPKLSITVPAVQKGITKSEERSTTIEHSDVGRNTTSSSK